MSERSFVDFLSALSGDAAMLARYNHRNLPQLLFHARNDGFDFTDVQWLGRDRDVSTTISASARMRRPPA